MLVKNTDRIVDTLEKVIRLCETNLLKTDMPINNRINNTETPKKTHLCIPF